MLIHLTSVPTTIMDYKNRVIDPIWTSCDIAYIGHLDILQG